jgi:hypothetical protein
MCQKRKSLTRVVIVSHRLIVMYLTTDDALVEARVQISSLGPPARGFLICERGGWAGGL